MLVQLLLLALCLLTGSAVESARILAIFPVPGKSQFVVLEALAKGLAARGHQVDVVSHFPQKTPIENYKDLSLEGSVPSFVGSFSVSESLGYSSVLADVRFLLVENLHMCEAVFKHPIMQKLLKSQEKYDLLILELFGVDCFLGFGYKFKIPVINLMTTVPFPWANDRVGNPDNPSYIPNLFLAYSENMNFYERIINTVTLVMTKLSPYLADIPADNLARRYFGRDLPHISELKKNVSLILANSHFSLHQARPLVPAMVEVAGLHLQKLQKLPEDIAKFLDDSPNGVIYFSLGSIIRSETFPPQTLQVFVEVFKELPYRVLWKCDCEHVPNITSNVKTAKWMPQHEILCHPNVRVFITHAGLMGTIESIDCGVPMVAIPYFGDQPHNAHNYRLRGVAVQLDPHFLSKENVTNALKEVLDNPSYKENAMRQSRLFRDRPQTAMETAIFWTEYVMRHHGAPHLQSPAVHMPLYQYLLMDVIAVLLIAFMTVVTGIVVVLKIVRKLRFNAKKKKLKKT